MLASDIDPLSVKVARENARLNCRGHLVQAIHATGFSAPQFAQAGPFDLVLANILANPLRQLATPMARHLAPSALVILSGLLTHQAASRHRRLSRARAGAAAASAHRRLEQPAAAQRRLKTYSGGFVAGDDALFLLALAALDARLDEPVQDLDDDAALLLGDGRNRAAADRRRNLLKLKAGIVYPLVVELKHSWNSPRDIVDERLARQTVRIRSNADANIQA